MRPKGVEVNALLHRVSELERQLQEARATPTGSNCPPSHLNASSQLMLDALLQSSDGLGTSTTAEGSTPHIHVANFSNGAIGHLSDAVYSSSLGVADTTVWWPIDDTSLLEQSVSDVPPNSVSRPALDAFEALTTLLSGLVIDKENGEATYLGPTSNLHMAHSMCSDRRRKIDDAVPIYDIVVPEDYILRLYWAEFHPQFPIFVPHTRTAGVQLEENTHWPALLYNMVHAIGAWNLSPSDPYHRFRKESVDLYLHNFTSGVGQQVDRCCLSNIQSFLLRSYLAINQGKLESATIFLGKESRQNC